MSGRLFRVYHSLLGEHLKELFLMRAMCASAVDNNTAICSIPVIEGLERLRDNTNEFVLPRCMIAELARDNRQLLFI